MSHFGSPVGQKNILDSGQNRDLDSEKSRETLKNNDSFGNKLATGRHDIVEGRRCHPIFICSFS